MARRLAWDLPRFEAADFAAAVIAVLKDRGGSTYLTQDAEAHADRSFHYRIEPVRENYATRVMLTISRPSWDRSQPDVEVFHGELQSAVSKFNAIGETAIQPREYQTLMTAEGALWRAHEEIRALCGERPDPDTEKVFEDIEDASRDLASLRYHLEHNDPWRTLAHTEKALARVRESSDTPIAGLPTVKVKLTMDAHRRFQRELTADFEISEE
ncbi:hypothetical protein [Antarctobacter sp.]|uniref:hypothetical protein n=1 Tax=Antarctobacter sp. TaxID=1872577 RepID=UPI002B27978F|nr:hypothetical protein [Antarctobacter sp.]